MIRPLASLLVLATLAGLTGMTTVSAQTSGRRGGFAVRIVEPENQSIVMGRSRIEADVEIDDPELVEAVEFLIGDEVIFIDREPPWECTHDFGLEPREWIIRAIARHVEEVSTSDAVVTRAAAFVTHEHVDEIVLWVSAYDDEGRPVTDLDGSELRVFEEDKLQQELQFAREERPISLAILLDSSGSMKERLGHAHRAAGAFVDTLRPEDQALVIDFDDEVFLIQELTSDHDELRNAVQSTRAVGGTALYDVLHAAYRKIGGIPGRKAVVLLSDGEDTSSQYSFHRVREEARASNVLLYAIGLGSEPGKSRRNVLRELAEATGGRAFFVTKAEELAEVYGQIADELRSQYVLSYTTRNDRWDGRFVPLRVEIDREGASVRSREGYFAFRRSDG